MRCLIVVFAWLCTACDDGLVAQAPDTGGPVGTFLVTWSLDGGCPPLATTAMVGVRIREPLQDPRWFTTADPFPCADGSGETRAYPPGEYDVAVLLSDDSGFSLFARSDAYEADLVEDNEVVEIDTAFPTDRGAVNARWEADDCNSLGGSTVRFEITSIDGAMTLTTEVACDAGSARIEDVALGDWTEVLTMLDSVGAPVSVVVGNYVRYTVAYGNQEVGSALLTGWPPGPAGSR